MSSPTKNPEHRTGSAHRINSTNTRFGAQIQKSLEGTAAAGISLSDLIAYGGAYAVRITGGPSIKVPIGRLDVTTEDPEVNILTTLYYPLLLHTKVGQYVGRIDTEYE